jgi:hypothetical protein
LILEPKLRSSKPELKRRKAAKAARRNKVAKPKNVAGIERDSTHAGPGIQKIRNPKSDVSETVGAAAAAKARRLKTIGAANDKK